MLLSEFSGVNKALNGYLEFNPFDVYFYFLIYANRFLNF